MIQTWGRTCVKVIADWSVALAAGGQSIWTAALSFSPTQKARTFLFGFQLRHWSFSIWQA